MSVLIDTEIARHDRGIFEHRTDGQTFGHKPVVQPRLNIVRRSARFDPDQNRCHTLPRRFAQPILRKRIKGTRIKRALFDPFRENRVGHEFRVLFPLQPMTPDLPIIMGRTRLRMGRAVAIQQFVQMGQISGTIAVGSHLWLLERHISGRTGRLHRWKRARMQLVRQLIAQRVIFNCGHVCSDFFFYERIRKQYKAKLFFMVFQCVNGMQRYAMRLKHETYATLQDQTEPKADANSESSRLAPHLPCPSQASFRHHDWSRRYRER